MKMKMIDDITGSHQCMRFAHRLKLDIIAGVFGR